MSVGGLLAVLCFLAGFSILTENRVDRDAEQAGSATRLGELYGDARFWVGQEESLERKYRLEPGPAVRQLHTQAARKLIGDLNAIAAVDRSTATRQLVARLVAEQGRYTTASESMLDAVDQHNTPLVIHYDHKIVDPIFGAIQTAVYAQSDASARQAQHESNQLLQRAESARGAVVVAFAVGLALLSAFSLVLLGLRRRIVISHRAELRRLAGVAMFDSLTELRNHRAFQEDLKRDLALQARDGRPLTLMMLDLNGLKKVNDAGGHQAGDERLRMLADTLGESFRGGDCAYRVGGDEFAVILPGLRAWDALETIQRVQTTLAAKAIGVTAGIAEANTTHVDQVIREADLALIDGKRHHQAVTLYSPELEATIAAPDYAREAEHVHCLSSALALAVDAKDSYTRSHCQTVSQLCALIATELALDPGLISQIRLAGLLHDVGKIGVPDAILSKSAALTDSEYEQMKRHPILGEEILAAADLPEEAGWVRHHHERYDGHGYPDGIGGEDIPLQSRIIIAADAFEAMTSDRPYRKAPGRERAIAELRCNAGTQFDPVIVQALCRALDPGSTESGHADLEGGGSPAALVALGSG